MEGSFAPDLKLIDGQRKERKGEIVPGFQLNKWAAFVIASSSSVMLRLTLSIEAEFLTAAIKCGE